MRAVETYPTNTPAIRLVIVDDDEKLVSKLRTAMEIQSGFEVLGSAGTLADAYAMLENLKPDIALVDLGLPDGNGLDLIRFIHSKQSHCETVVLSVFTDESNLIASIEAGATGYLTKDSTTPEILARLQQLKAGGSPISPVIARQLLNQFRAGASKTRSEPASSLPAPLDVPLSDRELQVLEMVAKGFMQAEIATMLGVSINTVSTYVKRIYKKLAVNSRTGAVHRASELGIINLREH